MTGIGILIATIILLLKRSDKTNFDSKEMHFCSHEGCWVVNGPEYHRPSPVSATD
jgi:hypothetical protein